MQLPSLTELDTAAAWLCPHVSPTPQYAWPILGQRFGATVWVKHENHTPIGAFKVRGGLVYLRDFRRRFPDSPGVIAATRGNHGQSVAFAARQNNVRSKLIVPEGNSREKNAAMQAWGGELIVHGHDFQAALEYAQQMAHDEGWHFVPSFHRDLVQGVGTAYLELLRAVPDLDTLYVPIGLGSGICGAIAARNALGHRAKIIGVVADGAPCYALSFEQRRAVPTDRADTFADGLACRTPNVEALSMICVGAERIVRVTDDEIAKAIRAFYQDTHQLAEGAGAAALAAAWQEKDRLANQQIAVALTGGNIDREIYRSILERE
ncbi:MAG: threonine dehydratase [Gemmataceae bacterium]|nr:threonine dehydratase [Gemmataceae bacterium]